MWKTGHNESNCWGNKRCQTCGKTGHDSRNCWKNMRCTKCGKMDMTIKNVGVR